MRLFPYGPSVIIGLVLTASACGPLGQPPAATSASFPSPSGSPSSAPSAPASPTATQAGPVGYLEARIIAVGPLQPAGRAAEPTPTIPPAACTSRGLVIFDANTNTEVTRVSFGPDCTCRVALAQGSYRVELDRRGIERSPELPKQVTIVDGQTTQLEITIDTGLR